MFIPSPDPILPCARTRLDSLWPMVQTQHARRALLAMWAIMNSFLAQPAAVDTGCLAAERLPDFVTSWTATPERQADRQNVILSGAVRIGIVGDTNQWIL